VASDDQCSRPTLSDQHQREIALFEERRRWAGWVRWKLENWRGMVAAAEKRAAKQAAVEAAVRASRMADQAINCSRGTSPPREPPRQ
jgi:hypothetical protein